MMHGQTFSRRHSPNRRRTRMEAEIDVDGTLYRAIVRDVSFDGMKLSVPLAIEPGSPVAIRVLEQRIPAIVHWYRAGHAGVHLLARLDGRTLIALETAQDDLAEYR